MHKLTFYPLGNADCCLIDLNSGRKILCDYAHCADTEDEDDLRIDLAGALRSDLKEAKRDYYDVVIFTHLDDDHICGSSEFFYLDHAEKYQDKSRIKINEMWVPVAALLETGSEGEAAILRAEVRHRFREGKGIKVFSRPDTLRDWCKEQGIDYEKRKDLIVDAGRLVPGWTKTTEGVEFFVHSPFAKHCDDKIIERNEASIVMQATFCYDEVDTRLLLSADATHEVWTDIVQITRYKKNDHRLEWDVYKIPHHCSYLSLSSEKGKVKTDPIDEVKWLHKKGHKGGIVVSTSKPIPSDDEDDQPPHRQAASWYKDVVANIDGEFKVTMEHPRESNPQPLVITIDGDGARLKKPIVSGGGIAITTAAPRAG
jgi:hypothetical protein